MKPREIKPSDIVYDSAKEITEDSINGVVAIIEDLHEYKSAFTDMARELLAVRENLEKHTLRQKWMTRGGKTKTKRRIREIVSAMALNVQIGALCSIHLKGIRNIVRTAKQSSIFRNAYKNYRENCKKL